MGALTSTRRLFGAIWLPELRSVPGGDPVFTCTSPFQPTATNHAHDCLRATMAGPPNCPAALAPGKTSPFSRRLVNRARRIVFTCVAVDWILITLLSTPPHGDAVALESSTLLHGFCCAGSPIRRGCAARRRTSAGLCTALDSGARDSRLSWLSHSRNPSFVSVGSEACPAKPASTRAARRSPSQ
jgi:hypothetical protein